MKTKLHLFCKPLGCTLQEYRTHIESQFTPLMDWSNYNVYWAIYHIDGDLIHNNHKKLKPIPIPAPGAAIIKRLKDSAELFRNRVNTNATN